MDATVIGSVLGSVIPSVLGFAVYICNFYLKIKQKGWRNLNEQDWRELGVQIEKEFNLVSSVLKIAKEHRCCEHCQKTQDKLVQQVEDVQAQITKAKDNLITKANTKVEENLTPPSKR